MSIRPLNACAALLLAGLASSCVFAYGTDDSADHPALHPKDATVVDATGGAQATEAGESAGKDPKAAPSPEVAKKKAERKAEKKAREVTYATMELALAKMEAENDERDAKFDVEHARQDLEAAQRELDHFQKQAKPLELEDSQLDVDRSIESALERQQELDELTSMYKKDEVAKMTKELVLQRGKKSMEFAQRELDLDKKRAADKKEHDLTVKERDLSIAVAKAQQGATAAEAKLKNVLAHSALELLRANHKLEDAQRPDDDEGSADGESKGA